MKNVMVTAPVKDPEVAPAQPIEPEIAPSTPTVIPLPSVPATPDPRILTPARICPDQKETITRGI